MNDSSPEREKIVTVASSPVVKDSPFFNYISNLSPLHDVKPSQIRQGLLDYNVPPTLNVFTSPKINPQPEINFLMRSKHPISLNARLSLDLDKRSSIGSSNSEIYALPTTKFSLGRCSQREHIAKHEDPSTSDCDDQYLSDSVRTECVNSANLSTEQGNIVPQASISGCMRSNMTPSIRQDTVNNMSTQVSDQSERDDLIEKSLMHGEVPPNECIAGRSKEVNNFVTSKILVRSADDAQHCYHLVSQVAADFSIMDDGRAKMTNFGQSRELDCNPQDYSVSRIKRMSENRMTNDSEEVGQHQRGMHRRCLQFVEANKNTGGNCFGSCDVANITPTSDLAENADMMDITCPESRAVSSNNQPVILSEALPSQVSPNTVKPQEVQADRVKKSLRKSGNSTMKTPRPSGIGLHLNSIVNPTTVSSNSTPRMDAEKDNSFAQRDTSSDEHHLLDDFKSKSVSKNIMFEVDNGYTHQGSLAMVESSANYSSSQEHTGEFEELNQVSPQYKRSRTSNTAEIEGCKRCNCKRSKCLKLYCECFAAGIYCAEPCACLECFNKLEYKDMVLTTRHQILSRNPLAFAPKIVRRVTESPASIVEEVSRVTPASARHKRGCNCKKSLCLKKYCECFQAGVGCSEGCRCEGCKNSFGVKEEIIYKSESESWGDLSYAKLDMVEERSILTHPEKFHPHHLSPLTPSFQRSSHGKDVAKSRVPAKSYLPSPESDPDLLSNMRSAKSLRHFNSPEKQATGDDTTELISYKDMEFQFSPKWEALSNICDLTPTPHPPSKVANYSSSSNTRDNSKFSRVQMSRGGGLVSPVGSLHWRRSPIPPMPLLSGSKMHKDQNSDTGFEELEDETPEILKETFTPIKSIKASSPNQKRISPPHNSLRSNFSPSLKSGRKFVLQSISPFPSLNPDSDSKVSSSSK